MFKLRDTETYRSFVFMASFSGHNIRDRFYRIEKRTFVHAESGTRYPVDETNQYRTITYIKTT